MQRVLQRAPMRLILGRVLTPQRVQIPLLEATLAKSSYLGEYFEHTLQTELGEVLVASGNTTEQLSPGQLVGLGFNPDTVVLLQD